MDWQAISTNWTRYRADFRKIFERVTDAELDVTHGDRSRLVDKVRDAYHLSQEDAEQEVDVWAKGFAG